MSDPWTTVAWSSLPVTAVALAALVAENIASRRSPRAGSWVAKVWLAFIAAVTPLAFCPVPAGWTWHIPSTAASPLAIAKHRPLERPATSESEARQLPGLGKRDRDSARLGGFWRSLLTHRLDAGWWWVESSTAETLSSWMRAWGLFLSLGAACALFRLFLGLRGVRACRLGSTSISDPEVLALVDSLRSALGCRRAIEVRERTDRAGATAAAVGWRHPLILLPREWRDWSAADRQAVMAHEVAHVARGDYAAGVVARFGLALHFYHPLVHWLLWRMLLQQELAADAQGARLSGGSRTYLLALSRLALRLEDVTQALPAQTFLAARGQLIRRIQMLRRQVRSNDSPPSALGRTMTIAVLGAVGLGIALLRGSTSSQAGEKPVPAGEGRAAIKSPAPTPNAPFATRTPFDLSYFPGRDMGFVVARPAAIFRIPGMKQYAEALNEEIADLLESHSLDGFGFDIELIEQAAIGFNVLPRDRNKGVPGRFMTGAFVLRSVHDRDWLPMVKALVKALVPKYSELTPVHFEGHVYYTAACPGLGPFALYFPDGRTVAYAPEQEIRAMIKRPASGPPFLKADDWKAAGRGLYAIAINNNDHRWKFDLTPESPEETRFASVIETSSRVFLGLDWSETLAVEGVATYETDRVAEQAARSLQEILTKASPALEAEEKSARLAKRKEAQDCYRALRAVLGACVVHQTGRSVELQGQKKLPAREIAAIGMVLIGG